MSRRIKKVREQKAATTEAGSSSRGAVQLPIRQLLATKATELVAPDVWNSSGWGRAKRKRGQGEGNNQETEGLHVALLVELKWEAEGRGPEKPGQRI